MGKIIAIVTLIIVYITGSFAAGPSWPLTLLPLIFDAAIEQGPYFALMVAGWTAWVCICVLLYMIGEWLVTNVLHRFHEPG